MATNSCHRQQLILADFRDKLQLMVAFTKNDFAARLHQACDEAPIPITKGRGRRADLRRRVLASGIDKVSGESVRKWLSGESIPSMDNVRFIAKALNCETDWLLTGRFVSPKSLSPENVLQQNPSIYVVEKSQATKGIDHEQILIDGYRVADPVTKEHMLDFATKALRLFNKRSEAK